MRFRSAATAFAVLPLVFLGIAPVAAASDCPPGWVGRTRAVNPTISADGRYVAFEALGPTADTDDQHLILLRDTRVGTTRTITKVAASQQVISDDGSTVVYTRLLAADPESPLNNGRLYRYDVATGVSTAQGPATNDGVIDVSGDGRYVVFGRGVVTGDPDLGAAYHVYLRDTGAGTTAMVDVRPDGHPGDGRGVWDTSISANGRYVLFGSDATDLVTGPVPDGSSLYLRDLRRGVTERVPDTGFSAQISPDGRYAVWMAHQGRVTRRDLRTGEQVFLTDPAVLDEYGAQWPAISRGGREVAWVGYRRIGGEEGYNLYPVTVHDMATGTEVEAAPETVGTDGQEGRYGLRISANGRYVSYYTATALVPQDTNGTVDVYRRDLQAATTTWVSTRATGCR